jgi:hypothetical protein
MHRIPARYYVYSQLRVDSDLQLKQLACFRNDHRLDSLIVDYMYR